MCVTQTRSAFELRRGAFGCARRPGFTLVELLVVMAIIVLLMGILTPSIRRSIQQTYSTVCKSNLHDLGTAIEIYRGDSGGWLPVFGDDDEHRSADVWTSKLFVNNPAGRGSLICPADPWAPILRNNLSLPVTESGENSSYGLNEFIVASPHGFLANLDRHQPARPGETILLADMGPDTIIITEGEDGELGMFGPSRSDSGLLEIDDGYLPGGDSDGLGEPWLVGRHLGKINVLTVSSDVKEVNAVPALNRNVESYYRFCAAQQCTLCLEVEVAHYSFAESRAFWWTGTMPRP